MNLRTLLLLVFCFPNFCFSAPPSPVAPGAVPVKVADGFKFTEGPTADAAGHVYFTDQPNNRIHRYSNDGILTTFLEPAGRSNGLCFDPQGFLWACADENNELWRIDPATGEHQVMASGFENKRFNGPNDVWVHPNGGVYFTDPFFMRPYWNRGPAEQPGNQVFHLAPDGKTLRRVTTDHALTNGVVGSPDGKTLYVSDPGKNKVFAYNIQPDGTLTNPRVFCEGNSDGLTLDAAGNLYLTGKGITIVGPDGAVITTVDIPEPWTANVCFGGADRKTLFITASTALYTLQMTVPGASPP
jgi:gluconolactonase